MTGFSFAHEIILKDGKVIKSKSVWVDNGYVKYDKFGSIIGIPEERVEKIDYDDKELIAYEAMVVLNNGDSLLVENLSLENNIYECRHNNATVTFPKKDVKSVADRRSTDKGLNNSAAYSGHYNGSFSGHYNGSNTTIPAGPMVPEGYYERELNRKLHDLDMRSQGYTKTGPNEYTRPAVPHTWQYNQQYGILEYKKAK
jgi:hypothetical protein